jgi:hypothetical protein
MERNKIITTIVKNINTLVLNSFKDLDKIFCFSLILFFTWYFFTNSLTCLLLGIYLLALSYFLKLLRGNLSLLKSISYLKVSKGKVKFILFKKNENML